MLKLITSITQKIEKLAAKSGFVYRFACKYYHRVIHKEVALADITEKDHILCIGGGMCPFSAILFHQATGARVTVIDNNEKCIPKAQEVIKRLGIGHMVQVLHKDGGCPHISLADYTVVHFALQVCPMDEVFASVWRRSASGTKLLVRRPLGERTPTRCPCAVHKFRNIGSTALFTKSAA